MDWKVVAESLLESARTMQTEQLRIPASATASTAAVTASGIILAKLAVAINAGIAKAP